jgi:hypothetical protein
VPRDTELSGGATSVTPPYAAYVSFDAFIRRAAAEGVPVVVDKSLLIGWAIAAGNESGVLTSLKSLGLIDDAGRPTELYREIRLSPTRQIPALRRCIDVAYPGLPSAGRSVEGDRLHDYFVEDRGLTGQMVSKAMRFYRQIVAATAEDGSPADRPTTAPPMRRPPAPRTPEREIERQAPARSLRPSTLELSGRVRRHQATGRGTSEPGITVQVTVSQDIAEEELTALFRRVRRAWSRSRHAD